MITLVIDASVATSYLLKSQRTVATVSLFEAWGRYTAFAPYVFLLEMPWVLLKQERRSQERGLAQTALRRLSDLDIEIDDPLDAADLHSTLMMASRQGLGFYDAMYVMLAVQTGATLATRDGPQANVARMLGVEVLDVR